MGYDRGDSFPFDFEQNGIPFGSKSKGKLSPQPYPIRFERKYSFLSAPPIRCVDVREPDVSRHHGDPITGPIKPLGVILP